MSNLKIDDLWINLLDQCDQILPLEFFGVSVDLHTQRVDAADAEWFYGAHRRVGAARKPAIVSLCWAEGGQSFFASLLSRSPIEKRVGFSESGRASVNSFSAWSSTPSVAPPFAAAAFQSRFGVCPGVVVQSPQGSRVLVVGPNYVGKTALALELIDRGWYLIADNLAVVDLVSGLACRYLTTVGFRRGTRSHWSGRLSDLDTRTIVSPATGIVQLARAADLFPSNIGSPGPIDRVIRLQTGADSGGRWEPTDIAFFPKASASLAHAALPGLTEVRQISGRPAIVELAEELCGDGPRSRHVPGELA